MSELDRGANHEYRVSRLRVSCAMAPLEIQLLWMFEILFIELYLLLRDDPTYAKFIRKNGDKDIFDYNRVPNFSGKLGVSPKLAVKLRDYRHNFVHDGCADIAESLTGVFISNR